MSERAEADTVTCVVENRIAWVSFARPGKRNCMGPKLNRQMKRVIEDLEFRDDVGVLVLPGEGTSWSAGMDLKEYFRENEDSVTAKFIDGRAVAAAIRAQCAEQVSELKGSTGIEPCLAVIVVGDDPASAIYVSNKIKACEKAGITSRSHRLPRSTDEADLLALIEQLNADQDVHGILVQLPLPEQIGMARVLETIDPAKDVDGFHLYNVGGLVTGKTVFSPCTPYGVVKLLEHEGIPVEGQNVVVVGASNIVGKPMALMLMARDATVAICHAKTRDLAQFTILADILVVAAGVPGLITGPMVKKGAVVIDVGINRLDDGRIVGDVEFTGVSRRASHITPVPGGVGPMTVTMLLVNTVESALRFAPARDAEDTARCQLKREISTKPKTSLPM